MPTKRGPCCPQKIGPSCPQYGQKLPIILFSWPFVGPLFIFGICGIVSISCPFQPIVDFHHIWPIVGPLFVIWHLCPCPCPFQPIIGFHVRPIVGPFRSTTTDVQELPMLPTQAPSIISFSAKIMKQTQVSTSSQLEFEGKCQNRNVDLSHIASILELHTLCSLYKEFLSLCFPYNKRSGFVPHCSNIKASLPLTSI